MWFMGLDKCCKSQLWLKVQNKMQICPICGGHFDESRKPDLSLDNSTLKAKCGPCQGQTLTPDTRVKCKMVF